MGICFLWETQPREECGDTPTDAAATAEREDANVFSTLTEAWRGQRMQDSRPAGFLMNINECPFIFDVIVLCIQLFVVCVCMCVLSEGGFCNYFF